MKSLAKKFVYITTLIIVTLFIVHNAYTYTLTAYFWDDGSAELSLDPSSPEFQAGNDFDTAMQEALNYWNDVRGTNFSFNWDRDSGDCEDNEDEKSVVCFLDNIPGALGVTAYRFNGITHHVIETDIMFTRNADWVPHLSYEDAELRPHDWDSQPSFYGVALHELGHSLGLDHNQFPDYSLMNDGFYNTGEHHLWGDDKAGVRARYPSGSTRYNARVTNWRKMEQEVWETTGISLRPVDPVTPNVVLFPPSGQIRVEFTMENAGTSDMWNVDLNAYLSTDTEITGTDRLLDTRSGHLPYHSALSFFWDIELPLDLTPGSYYVGYIIDANDDYNEGNHEWDNSIASYAPLSIIDPNLIRVPEHIPSIQAAINAVPAGWSGVARIEVAPGTYEENLTINKSVHIVSTAGPDSTTLLTTPGVYDAGIRFSPIGGNTQTLEGFNISHTGSGKVIYITPGVRADILNNKITATGGVTNFLEVESSSGVEISENELTSLGTSGNAILVNGGSAEINNNLISGFGDYNGTVVFNSSSYGGSVEWNSFVDNRYAIVTSESDGPVFVSHNIFQDNEYAVSIFGGGHSVADSVWINNNIFEGSTAMGVMVYPIGGSLFSIKNNIFYYNPGIAVGYYEDPGWFGHIYNSYFGNGSDFYGTTFQEGEISAYPDFVDENDYHLELDSMLVDAGDPGSYYGNEPSPNGDRINIGLYGNTAEAATTDNNCTTTSASINPLCDADGCIKRDRVKLTFQTEGMGCKRRVDYIQIDALHPDCNISWEGDVRGFYASRSQFYYTVSNSIIGYWKVPSGVPGYCRGFDIPATQAKLIEGGPDNGDNNRISQVSASGEILFKPGGSGGCFAADTPIALADGTQVPISKLKLNDMVLAWDEKNKIQIPAKVTDTFRKEASSYYLINGTIKVTETHPFYVDGKWLKVRELKKGTTLLTQRGNQVEIDSIKEVKEPLGVYNITVDKVNNYYAGGFLVHNKKLVVATQETE